MVALEEVLNELHVSVVAKVERAQDDWLFLIARPGNRSFPPPPHDCYYLFSESENNLYIYEEEAEAIRRHFDPPQSPKGKIITLGL